MGEINLGNSNNVGLNAIFNLSDYICSASHYIRNKYVHKANNVDEYDTYFFMYDVSIVWIGFSILFCISYDFRIPNVTNNTVVLSMVNISIESNCISEHKYVYILDVNVSRGTIILLKASKSII